MMPKNSPEVYAELRSIGNRLLEIANMENKEEDMEESEESGESDKVSAAMGFYDK